MMGERTVMQEALFYGFRLEDHVPQDRLLRSIDRFVGCCQSKLAETGRGRYGNVMFGNLAPGRYAVFVSRTRVVSRVRVGLSGEQEQVSTPISAGDGRRYALNVQRDNDVPKLPFGQMSRSLWARRKILQTA